MSARSSGESSSSDEERRCNRSDGWGSFSEVRCITAVPDSHYHFHSCGISLNEIHRKHHFKAKLTISLGNDNRAMSMAFQDFGKPSIAGQSEQSTLYLHSWRFVLDTNMKKSGRHSASVASAETLPKGRSHPFLIFGQ